MNHLQLMFLSLTFFLEILPHLNIVKKLTCQTEANGRKYVEIMVSLKYLSNC